MQPPLLAKSPIAVGMSRSSSEIGAGRSVRPGWGDARCASLRTDVLALNGSLGGAETQTNVLVPSPTTLARPGGLDLGLAVEEDYGVAVVSAAALSPIARCGRTQLSPRENSLCGCFWKARSLWTVSSVAILSVGGGPKMCCCRAIGLVFKVPIQIRSPPEYFANPNVALERKTVCMRRTYATFNSWHGARATLRSCAGCSSFAMARPFYLLEGVWPMKPR